MDETIFKVLIEDHDRQRKLMDKLCETSGDSATRRQLFDQLVQELERHAKYEERYFYKPLLESDRTQDKARHGIAEHKDIDDKIEQLKSTEFSSTGWLTVMKSLRDLVVHHLNEEENEVFQAAGRVFENDQKYRLAQKFSLQGPHVH